KSCRAWPSGEFRTWSESGGKGGVFIGGGQGFATDSAFEADPVQFGDDRRDGLEQVADKRHIGNLHQRRLSIGIDGEDGLRPLDTRQMLQRPRNAYANVEVGCHDLAGLADLQLVRGEAS